MKKKAGMICLLLCMALVCAMPANALNAIATTLSEITSDSIKEKESQISDAESELSSLKSTISSLNETLSSLQAAADDISAYITQLDAQVAQLEDDIKDLKAQIATKEAEIEATQQELEEALAQEEAQEAAMIARIRDMYKRGESSIFSLLLSADSLAQMLNLSDYEARLNSYDVQLWTQYQEIRAYVELCEAQLELEKEVLDEAEAVLEEEQAAVEILLAQKEEELAAYETQIAAQESAIAEYEAEVAAQNAEIAALEAAIEAEKKALLAAQQTVLTYDNGTFKFPLATYTRISDDYGWRIHPTLGTNQFHNGVDFAAPYGTAIYAAYDGVVVAAAYSSTMGNYVMINHGSGLYTIYMHASKLYVSEDDVVSRGDTIAAVGSTGRSTGNHLHFSVRLNGEYVSPWNYLSN